MHDFHCSDPQVMSYSEMAKRLRYLKETEAGQMELTGLAATFVEDSQRQNAERMLQDDMDKALIAKYLNIPIEVAEDVAVHGAAGIQ